MLTALSHAARQMPRPRYPKYVHDHGCRLQLISYQPSGQGNIRTTVTLASSDIVNPTHRMHLNPALLLFGNGLW